MNMHPAAVTGEKADRYRDQIATLKEFMAKFTVSDESCRARIGDIKIAMIIWVGHHNDALRDANPFVFGQPPRAPLPFKGCFWTVQMIRKHLAAWGYTIEHDRKDHPCVKGVRYVPDY